MLWSPSRRLWLPRLRRGALGLGLGLSRGQNVVTPALDYPTRWGAVSHWRLEEASGNRVDAIAANHLVPTGAPGRVAGKLGFAVNLDSASGQFLAAPDTPSLRSGASDFWVSGWGNPAPSVALQFFITKTTGGFDGWQLTLSAAGLLTFSALKAPGTEIDLAGPVVPDSTWTYFLAWFDAAGQTINLRVNDGTIYTAAYTAGGVTDAAAPFSIGSQGGVAGSCLNGWVDAVTFGKAVPGGIASRIAEISSRQYAAGSGLEYPWS